MFQEKNLKCFFEQAGIVYGPTKCEQIHFGGNNRTFKVQAGQQRYILKEYFLHDRDPRNRLEAEYAFLTYAERVVPGWTPRPIARDNSNRIALYEFIDGIQYSAENINWDQVLSAARFFLELNQPYNKKYASSLPLASEACFTVEAHLGLVKKRVESLRCIEPITAEDREALVLVIKLEEILGKFENSIGNRASHLKIDLSQELSESQFCISPSDFGFHNALLSPEGQPKFLDFEYAGWDDPAKMVGDFFSQLSVPVPQNYFSEFMSICMSPFPSPDRLIKRARLLAPLYKIKWCSIALNIFLPVNMARRKFANNSINENEYKYTQIKKARDLLNALGEINYGLY